MRNIIETSAPGKIILTGEHSVVYGQPALVIAIDKRAFTKIERINPNKEPIIQIKTKNYNDSISTTFSNDSKFIKNHPTHYHPLLKIIQLIYQSESLSDSLKISIQTEIPRGAGLGSSAAVFVSLSKALTSVFELDYSPEDISSLAFEGEKIVHGPPSGVDNTIATFGGCLRFQKGKADQRRGSNIQLIIGNTGISHKTKMLVSKVRTRYVNYPEIFKPTIEAMGFLVREAEKYLAEGNLEKLGEIFYINHGLLSTIGVSCPKLDHLVNVARAAGAYGAKLTGAGGGGCMFALGNKKNRKKIFKALQKNSRNPIIVNFEPQGLISTVLNKSSSLILPEMYTCKISGLNKTVKKSIYLYSKIPSVIRDFIQINQFKFHRKKGIV